MSKPISTCPFCGSSDFLQVEKREFSFYVLCETCGSSGPRRHLFEDAVADWNELSKSVSLLRFHRAKPSLKPGIA